MSLVEEKEIIPKYPLLIRYFFKQFTSTFSSYTMHDLTSLSKRDVYV